MHYQFLRFIVMQHALHSIACLLLSLAPHLYVQPPTSASQKPGMMSCPLRSFSLSKANSTGLFHHHPHCLRGPPRYMFSIPIRRRNNMLVYWLPLRLSILWHPLMRPPHPFCSQNPVVSLTPRSRSRPGGAPTHSIRPPHRVLAAPNW